MTTNPARAFRPEPGTVPDAPGCYLFRDGQDRVVYVGKARSLRSRLASYFQAWSGIAPRTRAMLEAARSVEWIVVDSEVEALHLEYTLIQRHRPRYNIRYRDDKSYPYLVVTTSQPVPRARVARAGVARGDRRFGPYAHAYAIRETLDLLIRVFPVRTCSDAVYDRAAAAGRPCLLHHIDRCAAPCTGVVDEAEHRALVDRLVAFLDGDTAEVLARLEAEMHAAAAELSFEVAARRRDQLQAAQRALARQQVVSDRDEDLDVVALHADELEAAVQAFFVRRGRLVGRKGWIVDRVEPLTTAELLTAFLVQLYAERDDDIPPRVLLPELPADAEALGTLLAEQRRHTRQGQRGRPIEQVRFVVPQRGDKAAFLATVTQNAAEAFAHHRTRRASDFDSRSRALRELQAALDLDEAPLRIECYDISHLGGTEVVGSMVVFEDGLPKRSDYRRFKLSVDTNDDYAAMREVLARRFTRLVEERAAPLSGVAEQGRAAGTPADPAATGAAGEGRATGAAREGRASGAAREGRASGAAREGRATGAAGEVDAAGRRRPARFAYPPNLVVIDGGPGQLAAALEGVADLPVDDVAFVALAKRFEELWLPERRRPVVLPRGSEALYLVQRVRDEAHRFAVSYQRRRRRRSVTTSQLDGVPGIGPKRRQALLARFGSVAAIRAAGVEELATVSGVSPSLAAEVLAHLARGDDPPTAPTEEPYRAG